MLDILEKYLDLPASFIEIRANRNKNTSISIKSGEVEGVIPGNLTNFSVRVLNKGAWGFSSTNELAGLKQAARSALRLAKVSGKKSLESELSDEPVYKDRIVTRYKKNPYDYSLEEKANDLLQINKEMKLPKIANYETHYYDQHSSWFYLNSEGARIEFSSIFSRLAFESTAKDSTIQQAHDSFGGFLGYEVVDRYKDNARKVSERAAELLKAKLLKSGVYDVVIGPKMAGTFAHEAIGHACEADSVLTGESVLRGKIGERIGNDIVTICDDPSIEGVFGYYPYDDEGVKAGKTVLVEDGILNGYLHSRETAFKFKMHSTANARAQGINYSPIVRMSNTYFERGATSYDEMVDIRAGVYIEGMRGGAVDISKGEYQFGAEQGYLIEGGELSQPLRDLAIFGNILETLKKIDAVGKDFSSFTPGMCGKGLQHVRVSDSGPHIRIRGVRIGGA
jgi:TldD protein